MLGLVFLGLVLLVLAIVYFITPANFLPGFLPGYDGGSVKVHFKHGIGALLLAVASFVLVWFKSKGKSPAQE